MVMVKTGYSKQMGWKELSHLLAVEFEKRNLETPNVVGNPDTDSGVTVCSGGQLWRVWIDPDGWEVYRCNAGQSSKSLEQTRRLIHVVDAILDDINTENRLPYHRMNLVELLQQCHRIGELRILMKFCESTAQFYDSYHTNQKEHREKIAKMWWDIYAIIYTMSGVDHLTPDMVHTQENRMQTCFSALKLITTISAIQGQSKVQYIAEHCIGLIKERINEQ